MENKNLNMRKEMNSKTVEELRKEDVEREMKKIKERMQQRLREANTELSLKKREEEQKAKVEALRQKLQRERQAQIIKEMQERNAVEHKATVKAAQMAARKEKEAREVGKTPDFNLEEKRKKMMDAYYTQQDKVKARKTMRTEVNLKLAENDLEETKVAQERMIETEKYMQELREEQAKKIEEEKQKKTNVIKGAFSRLTSWPRRKIPTQEELNSDSIKEETAAVNATESKKAMNEKTTETLRESESTLSMGEATSIQEQSFQERKLQELRDACKKLGVPQETIDEVKSSIKRENEAKKRKIKEASIFANKAANVIKRYTSNLPLSRKDKNKTRNNKFHAKYGGFQVDEAKAREAANNSQKSYSNEVDYVI